MDVPGGPVLVDEAGAEEQRVVGAEGDRRPGVDEPAQRHLRGVVVDPERDVAARAHLERDLLLDDPVEDGWVLDATDPVPEPVRVQGVEGLDDGLGPQELAGVGDQRETGRVGDAEGSGELGGDATTLVVRQAEADDAARTVAGVVGGEPSERAGVERVRELTNGEMCDVVYDSVGKDTWEMSLDCLKPRSLMVSFGNASGPVDGVNIGILNQKGSLFVTRPSLNGYADTRERLEMMCEEFFAMIESGKIRIDVANRYPLQEAGKAQDALQSRKTTGSTILLP